MASSLAKTKAPSKDGIPIEFYLNIWDSIGPFLLMLLLMLHPHLTEGIIVLLNKRGDPLFLDNKRGPTLLNCALKILVIILATP